MEELEKISDRKIKEFFEDRLPEKITNEEVLDILFLVLGEKPGALVMGTGRKTREVLEDFRTEFNINMKVVKGPERSLVDRVLGRDTRFMKDSIFLARNPERFEILEDSNGSFCGFSDRAVGEFLGYPESAIEYYENKTTEKPAGMEVEGMIEDMIKEGKIDSNAEKYLEMISYLPAPKEENIKNAVEEGKKRAEIIEDTELKLED